jgi:N-acetylneuraminic acid mutarotase
MDRRQRLSFEAQNGEASGLFHALITAFRGARNIGFKVALALAVLWCGFLTPTASGQTNDWTWMGGSSTTGSTGGQPGVYGTLGTPAAGNMPGSREDAVTWTDTNGNLWLFGGFGNDTTSNDRYLNDLWEFNPSTKEWAWMSGSSTVTNFWGQAGVYGTLGQPAAANVPGGRYGAVGWKDSKGNLWLFGGWGCESSATGGFPSSCYFNDLWEFNPSSKEWTWMGGSDSDDQLGVYGTVGTPASANIPGGRENAVSWTDTNGNFWLFGGYGYDSAGTLCYLNDLWEFNPATSEWAWISGSSTTTYASGQSGVCKNGGQPGIYGALGTPNSGNTPGGRDNAVSWTDNSGNLWLFGGYGADSTGAIGYLNDLWEFNISSKEWTWTGGGSAFGGHGGLPGIYETWVTAAAGNYPGGRQAATSWTDSNGNLWLFGGFGYDSTDTYGYLNDLWEFNPSTREWAWKDGSDIVSFGTSDPGVYGTLQTPGFMNDPDGRDAAVGWTDKSGNLWLFGGYANDYPIGPGLYQALGYFNDLWEYQPNPGNHPIAATPSFSLDTGSYPAGQELTISDATPGAVIYYFVGGSALPTQYAQPITISSTETVEAIAVAPGYANSSVASADFTVPVTAPPTFSVASGTYSTAQTVAISSSTPGAIIYYAFNAAPTTNSDVYSGPLTVSSTETIEAIAVASGSSVSATGSASYTIWPVSAVNEWAWMGGANKNEFAEGIYGTLGVSAPGNFPGSHQFSSTWVDSSGNLWLFGGLGVDANGSYGSLMNDLWKFNPLTKQWTWMGGSNTVGAISTTVSTDTQCASGGCGQPGVYGTLGTPAAGNTPGGREGAASWTDTKGNFWLFGGYGYDSAGTLAYLNDLWEFSPATNEWAWIGGNSTVNGTCFEDEIEGFYCGGEPGVYGTLGTPAAANLPGGRYQATTWTDSSGNLWLFGGYTLDPIQQTQYDFNDLWKFNPSTKEWSWMGGNNTAQGSYCVMDPNSYFSMCGQAGSYGTLGTPSTTNMPGSRNSATSWIDKSGNLWLAGGAAFDADGNFNPLNDLWEFNTTTNQWVWMDGSSTAPLCVANWDDECSLSISAIYGSNGTLGVPAAGNLPGLFSAAANWTDKSGNFWLFAGSAGEFGSGLNDVWELNSSANEWTWMNGSGPSIFNVAAVYGTLGTPAAGNSPGSRYGAASWTDTSGNFWLFGDYYLNDLWEYRPSAPAPVPSYAVIALPSPGASNASVTVAASNSATSTIDVTAADGFDSAVALTASNLPSGVTASFSAASITGAGSSQLTIATDLTTATGTYTITVTGTSGSTTETTTVSLTVTTAPPPTFTLGVSPSALTINSGSQGTATLTVTPQYGFNSAVSFSCFGLPAGASCSFSPATVTPSGSSATTQLTIAVSGQSSAFQPESRPFLPVAALAALFGLFGWKRRRGLQFMALLAMAFVGLGLISACGGGGGAGGGGGSVTPPVTSTVTVIATSGSLSQGTAISLTVN